MRNSESGGYSYSMPGTLYFWIAEKLIMFLSASPFGFILLRVIELIVFPQISGVRGHYFFQSSLPFFLFSPFGTSIIYILTLEGVP